MRSLAMSANVTSRFAVPSVSAPPPPLRRQQRRDERARIPSDVGPALIVASAVFISVAP